MGENDPGILPNAAHVLAQFGEDIGAMMGLIDRSLAQPLRRGAGSEPSRGLGQSADLAIEHPRPRFAGPREPVGSTASRDGMAYFFKHQFEDAVSKLLLAIQDDPGFPPSYRTLAACYAHMGGLDKARAIVARLRAITSLLVPNNLPFRNAEDRDLFLSGLRLAAGEG